MKALIAKLIEKRGKIKESKTRLIFFPTFAIPAKERRTFPLLVPSYQITPYPAVKLIFFLFSPKVNAEKGTASPNPGPAYEAVPNNVPIPR